MNKSERKSNFDLMRVLCILLIIMYHYTTHNGYLYGNFRPQKFIYESTGIWGLMGVIGFVMVSSHFLYSTGSFSIQKALRVIFETAFYSTSITLILFFTGKIELGGDYLLRCIFSVFCRQYWFLTDYVIFYVMSPFLKLFCDKLTIHHHKWLLVVLFLITFPSREITHVTTFSRLGVFVYTYLLIAYFVRKPDNIFQRHYKLFSVIVFGGIIAVVCTFIYLNKVTFDNTYLDWVNDMTSITSTTMFLAAICVYFIFKNMNIRYSKILFVIGGSTLGIYLIHEHDFFHYVLFDNILRRGHVYSMTLGPLIYFVSCVGVLLGCALIHYVIEFIFKKTVYMLSDKYLKSRYKAFDVKYVPGQAQDQPV